MLDSYIVAFDPGETGSFALLRVIDDAVCYPTVKLFNTIPVGVKRGKVVIPNLKWKHELNMTARMFCPAVAVSERVHEFPGQSGAFTFGTNYGSGLTALELAGCEITLVEPKTWQRRLGLPHHSDIPTKAKRRTAHRKSQKELALKLFPELAGVKGDIFASVLIGYAAALDLLNIPLGQVLLK